MDSTDRISAIFHPANASDERPNSPATNVGAIEVSQMKKKQAMQDAPMRVIVRAESKAADRYAKTAGINPEAPGTASR